MTDVLALQELPEQGGAAMADPLITNRTSWISIFTDCATITSRTTSSV